GGGGLLDAADVPPVRAQGLARRPLPAELRAIAHGLEIVVEGVLGVFAGADVLEEVAVEDLEAEGHAVEAHLPQPVEALQVPMWRRLEADEEAQLLLDADE